MPFDLEELINNPVFQFGAGLYGASSPRNAPLLNAMQMLQKSKQAKIEEEYRKQQAEYMRGQVEHQKALVKQNEAFDSTTAGFLKQLEPLIQRQMLGGAAGAQPPAFPGPQEPASPLPASPMPTQMLQPPQQPQPSLIQPPQQSQQPPEELDRFGTPKSILRNLKQVESGGNRWAVGPRLPGGGNALGPFQFIPDTLKMLAQKGIKFNPFDEEQSEAAASQYLQMLQKKNNGDWRATLADYGGFKSKDPTKYVNSILGSPEQQALRFQQVQAQQQQDQRQQAVTQIPTPPPQPQQPTLQPHQLLGLQGGIAQLRQRDPKGYSTMADALKPDYEGPKFNLQQDEFAYRKQQDAIANANRDADLELRRRTAASEAAARDQKTLAEQGKAYSAYQNLNLSMNEMHQSISRLATHKGLDARTGYTSYLPPAVQGQDAMNAQAELDSLKGKIFVNASQAFRRMNETGGSVGQQSDWEGKQFVDAWARLSQAQSTDEFRAALGDLQKFLSASQLRMKASYDYYHGKMKGQAAPESFKRIVRTGKQDGKRVVMFEDGTTDTVE